MKRLLLAALLLASSLRGVDAQSAMSDMEDCLLTGSRAGAATVEYAGKTYYLRDAQCKAQFLTDPERFAQLFDALLELRASGKKAKSKPAPDTASLVPS